MPIDIVSSEANGHIIESNQSGNRDNTRKSPGLDGQTKYLAIQGDDKNSSRNEDISMLLEKN